MVCAMRVSFQTKLHFCAIKDVDVAKKLGDFLYQRAVVYGEAQWLRFSMRVFSFTIKEVSEFSILSGDIAHGKAHINTCENCASTVH